MKIATWMTTPLLQHAEIARNHGFENIVLDVEHGTWDLGSLDMFVGFLKALGMGVHVKILGPTTEAVQQAMDFGADSVIIPHVEGVRHAAGVCAATKYPPLGKRSLSGGRRMKFNRQDDDYFPAENQRTRCWPMCETAEALADIEEILKLPTVDGIFMGPTDLAFSRGRSNYNFSDDDRADIARVAAACQAAGKEWVMPAWSPQERAFAMSQPLKPAMIVAGTQLGFVSEGFTRLNKILTEEGLR